MGLDLSPAVRMSASALGISYLSAISSRFRPSSMSMAASRVSPSGGPGSSGPGGISSRWSLWSCGSLARMGFRRLEPVVVPRAGALARGRRLKTPGGDTKARGAQATPQGRTLVARHIVEPRGSGGPQGGKPAPIGRPRRVAASQAAAPRSPVGRPAPALGSVALRPAWILIRVGLSSPICGPGPGFPPGLVRSWRGRQGERHRQHRDQAACGDRVHARCHGTTIPATSRRGRRVAVCREFRLSQR